MTSAILNREQILNEVKALRASNTKPDESLYTELDLQLASLYPTLPLEWLTSAMLVTGAAFYGFLKNTGTGMYVCKEENDIWLWACKSTTEGAIRWKVYYDSVGNIVFNATIGSTQWYLNWRSSTGACKLYDSYDNMTAADWASETFKLYNPENKEYIGTWSDDNKELYNRSRVCNKEFGFQFINKAAFTHDDYLIYGAYMKTRP
jgi:hypothetical protein